LSLVVFVTPALRFLQEVTEFVQPIFEAMNAVLVGFEYAFQFMTFVITAFFVLPVTVLPVTVLVSLFIFIVPSFLKLAGLTSNFFGVLNNFLSSVMNTGFMKMPCRFTKKFNGVMNVLQPLVYFITFA
jgi:hypothetical protein